MAFVLNYSILGTVCENFLVALQAVKLLRKDKEDRGQTNED